MILSGVKKSISEHTAKKVIFSKWEIGSRDHLPLNGSMNRRAKASPFAEANHRYSSLDGSPSCASLGLMVMTAVGRRVPLSVCSSVRTVRWIGAL